MDIYILAIILNKTPLSDMWVKYVKEDCLPLCSFFWKHLSQWQERFNNAPVIFPLKSNLAFLLKNVPPSEPIVMPSQGTECDIPDFNLLLFVPSHLKIESGFDATELLSKKGVNCIQSSKIF